MVWRNKQPRAIAGFTLIELLVVISIISLLSSVVFASLNDAREKAHVSTLMQWSQSIKSVLGTDILFELEFDDPNDIFRDTVAGNDPSNSRITYFEDGLFEGSIDATPSNDGITYIQGFPDKKEGTIELVFNLQVLNSGKNGLLKFDNSQPSIQIDKTQPTLEVYWNGATGMRGPVQNRTNGYRITSKRWYHVVFTWTSDYRETGVGRYKLYVDGQLVEESSFTPGPYSSGFNSLGQSSGFSSTNFMGYIDRVRLYSVYLD
jgi:prepilin-type N-terminal cleavage/methylation domain-containing protein